MGQNQSNQPTDTQVAQQQQPAQAAPANEPRKEEVAAPSAPAEPQVKKIGLDEVKAHSTKGDCWIIIRGKVYDVSEYMEKHPGGFEIILENANGKDSTEEYDNADHSKRAKEMLLKYYIGDLDA